MIQTFHMADIGTKTVTHRIACAEGRIYMNQEAFDLIKQNKLHKGNPIPMAETAGILAVKKTADMLPLCHPLILDKIAFQFELEEEKRAIHVECAVSAHEKTGVEMEALMGVQVALLTIYDLTKPVDPALTISDVRLKSKQGGKRGFWQADSGHFKSEHSFGDVRVAVLTVSDRASRGEYSDVAGEVLKETLKTWGAQVVEDAIVSDEQAEITDKLIHYADELGLPLIVTTGGTGMAKRDHTPEVVVSLCDRMLPGFGELLRHSGSAFTSYSWLSRAVAGIRKGTLIVTLPGSPKAVTEGLEALKIPLLHAIQQLGL